MALALGLEIMKIDMRPVRAILLFCPYRAHILNIYIEPKANAIGLVYNWLTAKKTNSKFLSG
jgi:hypothetical protein